MSVEHVEARAGAYADSVTLMQITARAQAVDGVRAALVAMATDLNLGLMAGLGLAAPPGTGPNDMLVAIVADDTGSLAAALAAVDAALSARPADGAGGADGTGGPAGQPPRTTLSAARRSGPGLVLVSVPGQHAFAEAVDALDAGCDVMIFSDHVPVDQEIWLKDRAAERGLLVMGPDCGTAIVAGIGLGFSHSVRRGPIGLVAASGTGAQQVVCLLDAAGAGVSAVLGVGGRDLSAEVGGRSARSALAALDADPATELIVLLSKPPAAEVAAELRAYAASLATPVQFALIGPGQPDLTAAAEAALRATGRPVPDWPAWPAARTAAELRRPGQLAEESPPTAALGLCSRWIRGFIRASRMNPRIHRRAGRRQVAVPRDEAGGPGSPVVPRDGAGGAGSPVPGDGTGALRGLFAGGTLCEEAMVIAAERLGPVYSNVPLRPEWRLGPRAGSGQDGAARHIMIDFGDDELTAGRPHPMIDQRLRLDRLAAEAADPGTAVIMLDVVLGHGAHPDPAAEIAPAIAAARNARAERAERSARAERAEPPAQAERAEPSARAVPSVCDLAVVVSLIGAGSDPQGLTAQASALAEAGAHVFASNAAAARFACDRVEQADGAS
ncbi:MAG TPA: FdrA family protein [Streptosporangiaceae bacterium]|nr:FdrA family protein [Streptosporangiaceae bacterium]